MGGHLSLFSLAASFYLLFLKFPLPLKERGHYFHKWALVNPKNKLIKK